MIDIARPKSDKEVMSINFEKEVLTHLKLLCLKEKMQVSTFVNAVVKKCVISEYEFYRQKAKHHAAELHKYRLMTDTAPDKPGGGKTDKAQMETKSEI